MRIYDLSKELFSAAVYPGDPVPKMERVSEITEESPCQVTRLTLGSHSGTHMDAPCHFVKGGYGINEIPLTSCVGFCKLAAHTGLLRAEDVDRLLADGTERLLIQGDMQISQEAAVRLSEKKLLFLGIEAMSVGDPEIHRTLLSANIAVLESAVMGHVSPGEYFLSAQPILLGSMDGAQVRPILIDFGELSCGHAERT